MSEIEKQPSDPNPLNPAPQADAPAQPQAAPADQPQASTPPAPAFDEVQRELEAALGGKSTEQLMDEAASHDQPVEPPAEDHADEQRRVELQLVRGRISRVRGDDVFVDLTGVEGKNQGIVPLTQFERAPRTGSIMDFVVQRFDEAEGLMILSREGAVARTTWDNLQKGVVAQARVTGTNKGGLELEMVGGIRAFMPASHVDLYHVDDLEQFVGQKLTAVVQEVDRKGKRVMLSRRQHLQAEREGKRKKLWAELEVGQVRTGKVTSVVDYGAFVDLGGADGMIHISDMSYGHIGKAAEAVKVGDEVSVKILKLDHEAGKIRLGIKQVAPDPWTGIDTRFKPRETVSGRVLRTADFGAFVELEPGVEALLPISEMSWKRVLKAEEVVKEGDVVRVLVLNIDPAKRRISLSLKQAQGDPWVGAERTYEKNALVEATVTRITDFGAFVEIVPGVEGLVHISELSPQRVQSVDQVLTVGDRKPFRVLETDEENRRIRLSLKAVEHPPTEKPAAPEPAKKPEPAKRPKPSNLKGGMGSSGALGTGLGSLKL